ncbi:addiction module antidote protein, HigA family [Pantoea vagans]|nr:HigA family addiction module antitoxin [Pantoea vagans]AWP31623.1 addiction module antidote protein, HigA family [Pantoea vagans]
MPYNHSYERARQARRKALRSINKTILTYENLDSLIPAERIQAILAFRSVSLTQFAKAMQMPLSTCHYIVTGYTRITTELALRLSYVLGGTPGNWIRLQHEYELSRLVFNPETLTRVNCKFDEPQHWNLRYRDDKEIEDGNID